MSEFLFLRISAVEVERVTLELALEFTVVILMGNKLGGNNYFFKEHRCPLVEGRFQLYILSLQHQGLYSGLSVACAFHDPGDETYCYT